MISLRTALLFAFIGVSPAWPQSLSFTNLKNTTLSCDDAQRSVKAELKAKGFFSPYRGVWGPEKVLIYPSFKLDNREISQSYYDYPPGRPQTLDINLSADPIKIGQSLFSSPVYLSILGARIMQSCPDIGLVNLINWAEGRVPVGFFPDGTARTFEHSGATNDSHLKEFTLPDGSRSIRAEWGYYTGP